MLKNARTNKLAALLTLTVLLTGCASTSPGPIQPQPPQIPLPPPSLMQPVPQESYLERAQRNIEQWLRVLTASEVK